MYKSYDFRCLKQKDDGGWSKSFYDMKKYREAATETELRKIKAKTIYNQFGKGSIEILMDGEPNAGASINKSASLASGLSQKLG